MQAGTVVIIRHAAAAGASKAAAVATAKGDGGTKGGALEVLLGQSVVKNWLRSTEHKTVIMRYPGEWKFPGGVVDPTDAGLEQAAIRELKEEYIGVASLVKDDNSDISLHMVNKKITRPIKGKRYAMHNFAAMEDDNPWITATDIAAPINRNLQQRYEEFSRKLEDGSFWSLDDKGKAQVSPELMRVQWMPLTTAISLMDSSLNDERGRPLSCVNDWQRQEFEKYGITKRDHMYQTMVTLMEIGELGTLEKIKAHEQSLRASSGGVGGWFDSLFR
jgi:ADP-ribose pyrophosphatase YjhB (NUDIX family)